MSEADAGSIKGRSLYVVDGSNLIFRAFYAIRGLTNDEGLPTNAIYGFTAMLLKLVREEKPDYLAVVLDVSEKSFRTELYADYKAQRPPMPEDLRPQWPLIKEVTGAFNIPVLELDGFEALRQHVASFGHIAQHQIVQSCRQVGQLVGVPH